MSSPLKKILAVAVLAVVTSCSPLADQFDLDDSIEIDAAQAELFAGFIGYTSLVEGALDGSSPFDYYLIETEPGDEALIRAKSPSGNDMLVLVYELRGGVWVAIAGNDDCDRGTVDPCLETVFGGGPYLVFATTADYYFTGRRPEASYTMRVSCEGGPCAGPDEIVCGGFFGQPCPDDTYCDFPDDNCSILDVPGVCRPRPDFCAQIFEPVCACGDRTFPNACEAAAAGFDVSQGCAPDNGAGDGDEEGPFPPRGDVCGGPDAIECTGGQECDLSGNVSCGLEQTGECRDVGAISCPRPDRNTADDVCGCDGKVYANDCLRVAAGVALDPEAKPGRDNKTCK